MKIMWSIINEKILWLANYYFFVILVISQHESECIISFNLFCASVKTRIVKLLFLNICEQK